MNLNQNFVNGAKLMLLWGVASPAFLHHQKISMKWIAIAGTWRNINEQVEKDVRQEVSALIQEGNGIVTGGALGVDFFCYRRSA